MVRCSWWFAFFFSNLLTTAIQFFMQCNCAPHIERAVPPDRCATKKFICTLNEYKTHLICCICLPSPPRRAAFISNMRERNDTTTTTLTIFYMLRCARANLCASVHLSLPWLDGCAAAQCFETLRICWCGVFCLDFRRDICKHVCVSSYYHIYACMLNVDRYGIIANAINFKQKTRAHTAVLYMYKWMCVCVCVRELLSRCNFQWRILIRINE